VVLVRRLEPQQRRSACSGVEGVSAALVIGYVEYVGDLRNVLLDRYFDTLLEGGLRHGATLAAAAHGDEGRVAVDRDQCGESTVRRNRRVDLVLDNGLDLGDDRAFQIAARRNRNGSFGLLGLVGVGEHHAGSVGGDVEGGTAKLVDA
jgi:hypothetical protein